MIGEMAATAVATFCFQQGTRTIDGVITVESTGWLIWLLG